MQYLYSEDAGEDSLTLKDDDYRYLIKARRQMIGDEIVFRNLKSPIAFTYRLDNITKKEVFCTLIKQEEDAVKAYRKLHLYWCVIDPKTIQTTLPMLNQIGVSEITFVYCARSQKNFKLDFPKMEKILINSSQQCGRTDLMRLSQVNSLDQLLQENQNFALLDFGGSLEYGAVEAVLIGCEGGFSEQERQILQNNYKIGLNSDFILKSETAALSIAAKLLI